MHQTCNACSDGYNCGACAVQQPCAAIPHACLLGALPPCAVGTLGAQAAWALKSKAAMLLAAVTRQQGPGAYEELLPQLIASAEEGPMQASIERGVCVCGGGLLQQNGLRILTRM